MAKEFQIERVFLEDETLRDGLQSEKKLLSTEDKLHLFDMLVAAGVKRIQVGSFVHPKIVPQMADTDKLIELLKISSDVVITGLVLNDKGLGRAMQSGLKHMSMSVSASDTHSRKNANQSAAEALSQMTALINRAVSAGITVRAGVQCAFGCVYEGLIGEDQVTRTAEALVEAGASELNLADSTGMANPKQIRRLVHRVRDAFPDLVLSLHLHDTRGLGLANMVAGYEAGVKIFDTATGGLGGCPFIKGAAGNVSTEDAVNLFTQIGVDTGIDLNQLCSVVDSLETILEKNLPGRMRRVLKAMAHCA